MEPFSFAAVNCSAQVLRREPNTEPPRPLGSGSGSAQAPRVKLVPLREAEVQFASSDFGSHGFTQQHFHTVDHNKTKEQRHRFEINKRLNKLWP